MGRWWQVDPEAEQFYGMSPYLGMGNNPVNAADPNGDIPFFIIPNFSFNKGGFNVGMEVGIGVPGLLSASATVGVSTGQGGAQPYWSVQGGASGLYAGYGSGGGFAGIGINREGLTAGLNYSQSSGWSLGAGYGKQAGGYSASVGLSYGRDGWSWNANGSYEHQGHLKLKSKKSLPANQYTASKGDQAPIKTLQDWDRNGNGILDFKEANAWYREAEGIPIVVDAQSIDLDFINPDKWSEPRGHRKAVQTLFRSRSGRVFGNITIAYLGDNQFKIYRDTYNFEQHKGSSLKTRIRNWATSVGKMVAGQGTPYHIYFSGVNKVNYRSLYSYWRFPRGDKLVH